MYVNKSNLKSCQVTLKDYYANNHMQNMYTEKYNIQSNVLFVICYVIYYLYDSKAWVDWLPYICLLFV